MHACWNPASLPQRNTHTHTFSTRPLPSVSNSAMAASRSACDMGVPALAHSLAISLASTYLCKERGGLPSATLSTCSHSPWLAALSYPLPSLSTSAHSSSRVAIVTRLVVGGGGFARLCTVPLYPSMCLVYRTTPDLHCVALKGASYRLSQLHRMQVEGQYAVVHNQKVALTTNSFFRELPQNANF